MSNRLLTDDAMFYKYMWNLSTRTEVPEECSGDCRVKFVCDMRTSSKEREDQCRDQYGV